MTRFEEFKAERERVRTQEEWIAFRRKWFDTSKWPTKSPVQRAAESWQKTSAFELGGRRWGFTNWGYVLAPEARYEYFWTLHVIGDPLTFPHLRDQPERRPEDGWTQECHFCEIST
ncbi:MAG: hypothetical protein HY508_13100, partial [Acidobacteria bacterium]|nr:hypothetical protein [Acidobacteriota bacterium]